MHDDVIKVPSATSSDLQKSDRLTASPAVMSCRVGDDVVLFDSAGGRYYGLNEIGGAIFERISSGDNLGVIHTALAARYEIDPDALWSDMVRFANRIVTLQMATLTR